MATSVENCLNILRQDLLQDIPTSQQTSENKPLWLGRRVVRKVKGFGLKLADILRGRGWLSNKKINEREIRECRWARSVAGAGLVDRNFFPANIPEQELVERTRLARELWQKDPYSFALWCIEHDQPFPEHFLEAELIPWQMEQFASLGLNRNHAARMSLRLSIAVKLLHPSEAGGQRESLLTLLPTDTPDEIERKESYNETLLNLDHDQESADMYLDSFIGNYTPSEQIELLKACRDELATHPESHQLSEHNLLRKVINDRQKQETAQFLSERQGSDDNLVDFDTELDEKGRPKKPS
ncbi:hypothetical protein [Endozoicomonas sp. 8E]|uniref:hypothetical protein n=1 Tax=Endozoicomonas sp. 8E TaxID=3035692 RepID=UPI0029393E9D|nr:hypothetical protein [Endozoicomonas sp. 8E]WOG25527.1 hypothetical protein P6910_13135 [Endozoicomonas sp. 8E]